MDPLIAIAYGTLIAHQSLTLCYKTRRGKFEGKRTILTQERQPTALKDMPACSNLRRQFQTAGSIGKYDRS
jgi:hypothetical protein